MNGWLEVFVRNYRPACPVCRSSPLILYGSRCAGCGYEVQLAVKVTEIFLLAWGLALASLAIVAGCGIFLLLLVCIRPTILDQGSTIAAGVMLANCAAGVLAAILTVALGLMRRRFCRFPQGVQWFLVAATFFVMLVCAVSLGLTLH
jgi:hypothetical protein